MDYEKLEFMNERDKPDILYANCDVMKCCNRIYVVPGVTHIYESPREIPLSLMENG